MKVSTKCEGASRLYRCSSKTASRESGVEMTRPKGCLLPALSSDMRRPILDGKAVQSHLEQQLDRRSIHVMRKGT
ncbi:hypothetical protein HYQ46_011067 [Verticillium longisporum]|nr:hypothetical protein HYQ46_011067 [Verticillium longisporum]